MSISAKDVMDLRKKTGVSMMACKKALEEAAGDQEAAIEILRKSGEAKALKKADRETSEGIIAAEVRNGKGIMVKLACETDFVARNDDFISLAQRIIDIAFDKGVEAAKTEGADIMTTAVAQLGENMSLVDVAEINANSIGMYVHANNKIGALVAFSGDVSDDVAKDMAMQAVATAAEVVHPDEVDAESIEQEKAIYKEQLIAEGKPENIIDNIIAGKVKKYKEEKALLTIPFIKDPSKKAGDILSGGVTVVEFVKMAI